MKSVIKSKIDNYQVFVNEIQILRELVSHLWTNLQTADLWHCLMQVSLLFAQISLHLGRGCYRCPCLFLSIFAPTKKVHYLLLQIKSSWFYFFGCLDQDISPKECSIASLSHNCAIFNWDNASFSQILKISAHTSLGALILSYLVWFVLAHFCYK